MVQKFEKAVPLDHSPTYQDLGLFLADQEDLHPFKKMQEKEGMLVDYILPNQLIAGLTLAITENKDLREALLPLAAGTGLWVSDFG